jgi:uncharacterized protein
MPRWPGPLLVVGGVVLALGGAFAGALIGRTDIEGVVSLGWLVIFGGVAFIAGLLYVAIRQLAVRRYLPPERYRGPSILVLVLLTLAVALLMTLPFATDATAIATGDGLPSLLGSAVLLTSTQLALLAVSWLLVFRPAALEGLPSLPGRNALGAVGAGVGWGLAAALGAGIVANLVALLAQAIGMEVDPQVAAQAIELVEPWLAVLAIVVLAPIAEEVFFRGVVFNALLREAGPRWAYFGSAALFAVIHLSLIAAVPLFLLGLAFAWVYQRTQNLLAPIVMHAVVNGLSVAVALLARYDILQLPV